MKCMTRWQCHLREPWRIWWAELLHPPPNCRLFHFSDLKALAIKAILATPCSLALLPSCSNQMKGGEASAKLTFYKLNGNGFSLPCPPLFQSRHHSTHLQKWGKIWDPQIPTPMASCFPGRMATRFEHMEQTSSEYGSEEGRRVVRPCAHWILWHYWHLQPRSEPCWPRTSTSTVLSWFSLMTWAACQRPLSSPGVATSGNIVSKPSVRPKKNKYRGYDDTSVDMCNLIVFAWFCLCFYILYVSPIWTTNCSLVTNLYSLHFALSICWSSARWSQPPRGCLHVNKDLDINKHTIYDLYDLKNSEHLRTLISWSSGNRNWHCKSHRTLVSVPRKIEMAG